MDAPPTQIAPTRPAVLHIPIIRQPKVHCNPNGEPILTCIPPGYSLQLNGKMSPEEFQSIMGEINTAPIRDGPKTVACFYCPIVINPIFGYIISLIMQQNINGTEKTCLGATLPVLSSSIMGRYQGRVNLYISSSVNTISHRHDCHTHTRHENQYTIFFEVL